MNCQVWLHDHVIPVYNAGIKTFINYVDKSLPGHLMKATKMIWKHNIQVFKLHVYQGVQFCSEMKKKHVNTMKVTSSTVPVTQTFLIFQGTVHRVPHHYGPLLLPTVALQVSGNAQIMPGHVKSQLLHLQFHGLLRQEMLF